MATTLPPLPIQNNVSDDHLVGIGLVIAQWASIENLLVQSVCDLMAGQPSDFSGRDVTSFAVLRGMDARILLGLAKSLTGQLFHKDTDEFNKLADKLDKLGQKRNVVAHGSWTPGKRPGSIQTTHAKTVGRIRTERHEYTARELTALPPLP